MQCTRNTARRRVSGLGKQREEIMAFRDVENDVGPLKALGAEVGSQALGARRGSQALGA